MENKDGTIVSMKYNPTNIEFLRDLFVGDEIVLVFLSGEERKVTVVKPISPGKYIGEVPDDAVMWVYESGSRPEMLFPFKNTKLVSIKTMKQSSLVDPSRGSEENRMMKAFMTRRQRQKFTEGKQVGTLYHYTTYDRAFNIVRQDKMFADPRREGRDFGISFSRNGTHAFADLGACIVVDGDKLSNNYKIDPYN